MYQADAYEKVLLRNGYTSIRSMSHKHPNMGDFSKRLHQCFHQGQAVKCSQHARKRQPMQFSSTHDRNPEMQCFFCISWCLCKQLDVHPFYVSVHVYVHVYVPMLLFMCICICMICMFVCQCTFVYCMCIGIGIRTSTGICIGICIGIYVYMYICE